MIWLGYRLQMLSPLQCKDWLTHTEWQYALTKSDKRARQFCNGRALVRKILQQLNSANTDDIVISLPSDDAPVIHIHGRRWHLSVSHSNNAIAVALSDSDNMGVDIEQLKPRQYQQLSNDYVALQKASDLNTFYQHWTVVEAYSKYSGKPLLQILSEGVPDGVLQQHFPLTGYILSLVYQNENTEIILREHS